MTTVRQIERLFVNHQHRRLYRELVHGRPEAAFPLENVFARVIPISALGVIRMDELNQSHLPLYRRLLNVVLTSQQSDGGWGDAMTTALCTRALLCGADQGAAVERGINYLASLQKSDGIWPKEPLRRMPSDPFTSAFVLLQLGERALFRNATRWRDAIDWFTHNARALDPDSKAVWQRAVMKCRSIGSRMRIADEGPTLFSANRPAA